MDGIVTYDEFELFRDLIYQKAGIRLKDSRKFLVATRLRKRMDAHGLNCYYQYYKLLTKAPDGRNEMQKFINALTTNETYFFRHPEQFNCLTGVLIPEILGRKPAASAVRIWSAACASGEEAYSIAIQMRENRTTPASSAFEIIGSDINLDMIERANAATYNAYATSKMNPVLLERYFIRELDHEVYHLCQGVRKMVRFVQANLLDPFPFGQFDVIFCRNVLIYFDQETRERVLSNLHGSLKPGGYLITGYAESIMNSGHPFKYLKPTLYQKSEGNGTVARQNQARRPVLEVG
jgi:chemotaxis protein methyltransferase CheR